ncbi:PREDICTED: probable E3 ubiquitin-protein ligase XERICO [Tarenaya hassleriana]|uniref:probable E3 ubiquitin-protein ligase XERICO n=1 Tax=Tarenaya hassleriana TaxID=28532 RepID=UPI00053C8BB2|nr:PREDICTED: probable E3 ubiquitin-protein ligase XERICO [Tarenaya hassleriana]
MGLSHFPTASEGVLPLLVMNTVVSVSLLKNMVRSVLHVSESENEDSREMEEDPDEDSARRRRILTTQFKSLFENRGDERGECSSSRRDHGINGGTREEDRGAAECCVCLCGFEEEEEVSELVACKHFFHRACLDKWFGSKHATCPLCRSIP